MEVDALWVTVKMAACTTLILVPLSLIFGRWLAYTAAEAKPLLEALIALPLVIPPTVVGFFFLVTFDQAEPVGAALTSLLGDSILFSFSGLVIASIFVNVPFAVQPIQRAFEAIPEDVRESAACAGLGYIRRLWRIEIPLAAPGILMASTLTFAHTVGEFGVVLMVGGSIGGETRTISIAIYDAVQALDYQSAGTLSAFVLLVAFAALTVTWSFRDNFRRPA